MVATKELLAMKTQRFIEKSGVKDQLDNTTDSLWEATVAKSQRDSLKEAEKMGKSESILSQIKLKSGMA